MADDSSGEKTEQPTPQKRREARRKGEVAKSRELPSVCVLLAALLSLMAFGGFMIGRMQALSSSVLSFRQPLDISRPLDCILFGREVIMHFLGILCPLFAAVFLMAVISNVVQVGMLLSSEALVPKFSRLDPLKGLQRLFSKQALVEFAKSMAKLIIIAVVAYRSVSGEMERLSVLSTLPFAEIVDYLGEITFRIAMRCSMAMIVIVILDYAFQRWEFEQRLRMTKQELKDDMRKTEGDPLIKSRIRSIQMEMAKKRMMQKVPEADVVITNPTHLAVVLQYDGTRMTAPKVLAKGAGAIAEKIKSLAREHGVPIVENKPLAQNLYAMVEIDREIPQELYHAVAEVLAFVYRFKNAGAQGGAKGV